MKLDNLKIGLGITGSFCTFEKTIQLAQKLREEGATILPILSNNAYTIDTRFGNAEEFNKKLEEICEQKIIKSIVAAEPIGPKNLIDIMLITPCTGNTMAKLANAITDNAVLMTTKSHLRNGKPVVLGVSTNDALSMNAKNLGVLLNTKNIYFVPFRQDDYKNKPNSLVYDTNMVIDTIVYAMEKKQIQPLFL